MKSSNILTQRHWTLPDSSLDALCQLWRNFCEAVKPGAVPEAETGLEGSGKCQRQLELWEQIEGMQLSLPIGFLCAMHRQFHSVSLFPRSLRLKANSSHAIPAKPVAYLP